MSKEKNISKLIGPQKDLYFLKSLELKKYKPLSGSIHFKMMNQDKSHESEFPVVN